MAELVLIFKGQDGVGSIVNNIHQELTQLTQTTNTAKEAGTGFFSGMLQTAGGFLAANVLGGIGGQIKDFIGGAISDAKESNQIFAQTEAAIKSTGGAAGVTANQVRDMAGSISAAAGLSLFDDDDIQKGDNLLLTFTNIKETLPNAQQAMVDMATAMHTDVSAGAIQLGKALNDPTAGISALSRVGVTFTDEQKNMIKALQDSGDMAGAQTIILNELNKEFGGSAAAAAKADGGMAQFKAQLGDVGKEVGNALLPALGELTKFASENLMPILAEAAHWFADNLPGAIEKVKGAIAPLQPVLSALGGYFGAVAEDGDLVNDFLTDLPGPIQAVIHFVNDLSKVWADIRPVITNVVNAVGEVVNAIFGQVQEFLHNHGDDIKATMVDTWSRIMEIIKLGAELYNAVIPPVLRAIAGFIGTHGKEIQALLSSTWNSIKATIDVVLTLITGVIKIALDLIHGNWSQAWEDLKQMSARIVLDLWTIIKGGIDNIVTLFGGFVQKAIDFGNDMIQGIIKGVSGGIGALKDIVVEAAKSALDAAKKALGISSPSRAFADEVGMFISTGIAKGITDGGPHITDALNKVTSPKSSVIAGNARVSTSGDVTSINSGSGSSSGGTIRIVLDDGGRNWLKNFVKVEIDSRLTDSGNRALSRQRIGG